jgi:orotidine-5'-phosphate decarboxylase
MKPELIIALDVANEFEIPLIVDALPPQADFYKIGLELYSAHGPTVLRELKDRGKRVFLDLKLHDIPRTVARAVAAASRHGVDLLTIHAMGGREMMRAAAQAAAENNPHMKIVAVTTLTSLNDEDFKDLGIGRSVTDQALALGELALNAGIHGLVTSAHEAAALRQKLGGDVVLVTPGIRLRSEATPGQVRPAGESVGDQKRVATPAEAVRAGATYLVVGRPILDAEDPAGVTAMLLEEIENATAQTP